MIRRNDKIISTILAMTIVSGLATPVCATEVAADSSADQVFSLENADLEKISDDTDILKEVSETKELENNDASDNSAVNNTQYNSEQVEDKKDASDNETSSEVISENQDEVDVPLYDSIDEEMENYLKEYLQSMNSGISDEELEKLLQEYLEKMNSENAGEDNIQLEDGIYSINNNVLKMDSEEKTLLREYLSEESILEVKSGKISVILTFDKNVTELDEYKILINDKKAKIKTLDSDASLLRIKFNINNLTDAIVLNTNVTNDYFNNNEESRIILDTENIEKLEEEITGEDDENIQDGTYTVKNSILKLDQNKESVLGKYLSNESILEVKDGQKYLTLVFDKDASAIEKFNIYVNNYISSYKVVESSEDVLKVRFLIESIDDEIVVDANVTNEFYKDNFKAQIVLDSESLLKKSDDVYFEESTSSGIDSNEEIMPMAEDDMKDGTYNVNYKVLKSGLDTVSMMASYVKSSTLIVNGTKKVLTINVAKIGAIPGGKVAVVTPITNVNEQNKIETYEDDNNITIKFEIEDIKERIGLKIDIDTQGGIMPQTIDFEIESLESMEDETKDEIEDGTYNVLYTTSASLKRYLKAATLKVTSSKNNTTKKTLILNIDNSGNMIRVLTAKVEDKEADVKLSERKGIVTMEIPLDSIEDSISIGMTIDTQSAFGVMTHSVPFTIDNIEETQGSIEEATGLNDGEYVIGTNILKTGTTEQSMASGYFKNTSDVIVKNGKYTLVVYTDNKALSMMSNIRIKVNNTSVEPKTDINSGTISFEIPKLSSNILMICDVNDSKTGYVAKDTDFNIALDTKNIINKGTNEGVEAPDEDKEYQLNKNTAYTINNKIGITSSSNSYQLSNYLAKDSIIEVDKEGNMYLTLNFAMSGLMTGRTIKLNDSSSVTSYSVVNSSDTNGIRFKISSLNDVIHISNQYGSSISDGFTLSLVQDTLAETGSYSGGSSNSGSSTTEEDTSTSDDDIEDGTYVIKNYCYKEKSDTTSDARKYLDTESVLVVDDGEMYVILKFTHGKMMSNTSVKVEDKKASVKTVKKSGNKYYIKFKIDSLSDEIMVTTTIDTGVPAIGLMEGVKFRVLLRESTLKEDDDAADFDDEVEEEEEEIADEEIKVEEPVQDGTIVIPPSNEVIDNNTVVEGYKKSTYKVNNEIVTDSQIGYQAARGAVNQTSVYEIENEKKYITLGFSQTDILNNIRISNNGKNIAYTVVNEDKSKNTMNIRFEVPSLSTQLTVTANVTAMGRDISFGLKFLETTLELISTEESENITNNTGSGSNGGSASSGILSGLSSTMSNLFSGGSSSEGGIEVSEEAVEDLASLAKEYFKKYTVNNEVLSDSAIGRTMARKYLSETSIIEEIDGQLYATITFSSASSMGNLRIDVNGETVSHTVPLKDMGSDLVSLRFPISSVNDDIRTYIFISPMKMTIDFGIKFLEDTMTLIDEGTIGEEGDIESSSLADTLSNLNQVSQSNKNQMSTVKVAASTSVMVIVLNQGIAGIGSLFRRFKNKSLLSKMTNIE